MRFVIVTLLALTSTVATVAVAQDGTGHDPPKSTRTISVPQLPVPIPGMPTGYVQVFFQPQSELASMTK